MVSTKSCSALTVSVRCCLRVCLSLDAQTDSELAKCFNGRGRNNRRTPGVLCGRGSQLVGLGRGRHTSPSTDCSGQSGKKSGGFGDGTDVIAPGAKDLAAHGATTDMLVAECFAANRAEGNSRRRALDRSLTRERACHDAIAPTFGLDDEAHGGTPTEGFLEMLLPFGCGRRPRPS